MTIKKKERKKHKTTTTTVIKKNDLRTAKCNFLSGVQKRLGSV